MKQFHLAAILMLAALQPVAAEPAAKSVWMMVQHDVVDIVAWREVFDGGLSVRQSAGALQFQILTMDGPAATVLAIFEWTSEESALAFVNDSAVRNAMASAGVISEPVITLHENDPRYWITTDDRAAPATDMASGN